MHSGKGIGNTTYSTRDSQFSQAVAEDPRLQPVLKEAGLDMQKIEAAIQACNSQIAQLTNCAAYNLSSAPAVPDPNARL